MKFTLEDKVAIITGGGNGIGKAMSETFAEMGAIVHILDLNEAAGKQIANNLASKYGAAYLVTKSEITDPHNLNLWLKLNGEMLKE